MRHVKSNSAQQPTEPALALKLSRDLIRQSSISPGNGHGSAERRLRIALYSHDTMGLGHMRRNLLLAQEFAAPPLEATILLITGEYLAGAFQLPPRVDCLTLPAMHKEFDGRYRPANLDVSLQELASLRANVILAAVKGFDPDLLIVDKVPRGARRELEPTLDYLHMHTSTRCVLGLRDILDDPGVTRREWRKAANEEAIRDYYQAVWVYGDPSVYDPVREYGFLPHTAAKVRYVGYLDQSSRTMSDEAEKKRLFESFGLPGDKLALCVVGGGQDGAALAEAFALADMPQNTTGLIVGGPYMPDDVRERLRNIEAARPRLKVLDFTPDAALLLSLADYVVAMGGYNTVMELLSFNKRALVVPRVEPRLEQWIRAVRLSRLGLLDVLHPDELSPNKVTEWLASDLPNPPRAEDLINMSGLARLSDLVEEMLAVTTSPVYIRDQTMSGDWQHVS